MTLSELKKKELPDEPGVYFFKKGKTILYIGKATSLRDRVKSYFSSDLIKTRGPAILDMVTLANNVTFQKTDSVLEALILESALIKKYQPKYNVKERDDKSFNKVVITNEKFPRVLLVRNREILTKSKSQLNSTLDFKIKKEFGPFPNGSQLKEALRLVQKIFPFFDNHKSIEKLNNFEKKRLHLNIELGIYPDVFSGKVSTAEYGRTIRNISLFFQGKKTQILKSLERQMKIFSRDQRFEKAAEIKKTIFALKHINDISILNSENNSAEFNTAREKIEPTKKVNDKNAAKSFRIESYDVAHTFGDETVGLMLVSENLILKRSEMRKFILKSTKKHDDYGALQEILKRRFRHTEWQIPNIIVVDGGHGQRNVALNFLKNFALKIEVISVVKDEHHKPRELLGPKEIVDKYKKHLLKLNNETHNSVIRFHRKRRDVIK